MRLLITVLTTLALTPAAAGAATYYAAPDGTGEMCSRQQPCSLRTIAGQGRVLTGHEVVVAAGDYDLGDEGVELMSGSEDVVVRGAGATRTIIRGRAGAGTGLLMRVGPGSRLSDFKLVQDRGEGKDSALFAQANPGQPQTVIERVVVESATYDAIAVGADAVVRDAIAISRSTNGGAGIAHFNQGTLALRNVTAIGTSIGLIADGPGATGVRNSIVRGTGADGKDLVEKDGGQVAVAYTAYRADRTTGDVNRVGGVHFDGIDPQLDETTGRIARTSPLRDAADQAAVLTRNDVLGRSRTAGPKADVGAVELLVQPDPGTLSASAVGQDRATLRATVDPLGGPVTARLEVAGRTVDLGRVDERRELTTEVTGLPAGTEQTARLVLTDDDGELAGAPAAFRTAAPPAPAPPPAPAAPVVKAPSPVASAVLARTRLRRRASTRLTVTSPRAGRLVQVVERLVPGRRRGRSCTTPARAPRGRTCTRRVVVARTSRALAAGRTVLRFRPRARGRVLRAGHYVLRLDVAGTRVSLPFRLVR